MEQKLTEQSSQLSDLQGGIVDFTPQGIMSAIQKDPSQFSQLLTQIMQNPDIKN